MRTFCLFILAALLSAPTFAAPGNELSGGALPLLSEDEPPEGEREVSGGVLPTLPEAETPSVARDVGVDELPLLVDEPPDRTPERSVPEPVIGGQDSLLNPFAPLVVPQQPPAQAAPEQPQPTPPAAAESEQTPTAASEAPPAASAPSRAARPAAPVPEAQLSRPSLPSSLTNRMLPPTAAPVALPTPLGGSIATAGEAFIDPFATDAAIRTPSSLPPLASPPTFVGTAVFVAEPAAGSARLNPLSLSQTMFGDDENTTFGPSNRVSRALANLRVSFTAMSTGTGIFRVGDSEQPVLVTLGEALPGTELVLSSLTARTAQFSEDDVRHTLLLNP